MPPRTTSGPPAMTTIVMPNASSASTVDCSTTLARFIALAKPGAAYRKGNDGQH